MQAVHDHTALVEFWHPHDSADDPVSVKDTVSDILTAEDLGGFFFFPFPGPGLREGKGNKAQFTARKAVYPRHFLITVKILQ